MQADFLILADAATVAEGKLYIHGAAWDLINVACLPWQHPSLAVAIGLRFPWGDTNQPHDLWLDILDGDGQSILADGVGKIGSIVMGRPWNAEPGVDQAQNLTYTFTGLVFHRVGDYAVVLRADGADVARAPFRVRLNGLAVPLGAPAAS